MKPWFLGIELNGTVNKFRGARKSLKRGGLPFFAENAPDPKNMAKTGQNGRIRANGCINPIYAVDGIMDNGMLRC